MRPASTGLRHVRLTFAPPRDRRVANGLREAVFARGTHIAACSTVVTETKRQGEKTVGVACADIEIRARAIAQLRQAGASLVQSDPETLARTAREFDLLLIFADGLRAEPLMLALQSIDAMHEGPSLILVTDESPPRWKPTTDRALVVTLAAWTTNGLEWIRSSTSAVGRDYSGPELPFTD